MWAIGSGKEMGAKFYTEWITSEEGMSDLY
jgi:hypothetical protein